MTFFLESSFMQNLIGFKRIEVQDFPEKQVKKHNLEWDVQFQSKQNKTNIENLNNINNL